MIEIVSGIWPGNLLSSLSSVSEIEEGSKGDEKNYFPAQP